ncbi:Serine/threonine-protein kinase AFC3 [Metarhizium brunneum]|uniref:Serine/threonine-protein kinase AFC3 n=1 Tax=Metarhizium brunneum TaxID=500148 RepID=A0A7D5UVM7_9HYPO|nr:Serine/threonine-protein kinase AFC3 [Metarhizium brunneum]
MINEPIDEELLPGDRLRSFHPTRPGEMLNGRFKTITKLGYGVGSPVWLAENIVFENSADKSAPRYVAVKIAALDLDAGWEAGVSKFIANAEPSHVGLDFIRTHIDIKVDNIMMTIEGEAVKHQMKSPQPKHIRIQDGRETYLSQGNFGPLQGSRLLPKLADFNIAFPVLANGNGHLSAIQSHRFRAPEVILGCPWSYSVEIWNLGLLMWNLMEGIGLFDRPAGEDGEYNAHVHLAQMVSLLGEPDEECMKRERFFRNYRLEKPVVNSRGKECNAMTEFWVGPFFNDENDIVRTDLVERKRLEDTVTELVGHEKDVFLDFASGMLQ